MQNKSDLRVQIQGEGQGKAGSAQVKESDHFLKWGLCEEPQVITPPPPKYMDQRKAGKISEICHLWLPQIKTFLHNIDSIS